jgi:hypothetical protein
MDILESLAFAGRKKIKNLISLISHIFLSFWG